MYTYAPTEPQPKSDPLDPFEGWESEILAAAEAADRELKQALATEREAEERRRAEFREQHARLTGAQPDPEAAWAEAQQAALLAELDSIGTSFATAGSQPAQAPYHAMPALIARDLAERLAGWTEGATRTVGGRVYDLLPPGTPPRAGDEIEDEGTWRPRPVLADYPRRYDRAVFARVEAERAHAANPTLDLRTLLAFALAGAGVLAERDRDDADSA